MQKTIISVIGIDRPGILAAVSKSLRDEDCNIENISQTLLQSIFGAIIIVSKPDSLTVTSLETTLKTATAHLSLDVSVKTVEQRGMSMPCKATEPLVITTTGPDNKGLVAGITRVLAEHGSNITNLQAVFKGGENPLNNMMIYEVDVPKSLPLSTLYSDLETTATALNLEINIQHRRVFEAINRI